MIRILYQNNHKTTRGTILKKKWLPQFLSNPEPFHNRKEGRKEVYTISQKLLKKTIQIMIRKINNYTCDVMELT